MSVTLRPVLAELVAELRGSNHPGESKSLRAYHAALCVAKAAGQVADALDLENRDVELPQLANEISTAIVDVLKGTRLGVVAEYAADKLLPVWTGKLLNAAADRAAVIVTVRDDVLVPALERVGHAVDEVLLAILPDA